MSQTLKDDDQRTIGEVLSDGSDEEYREASHRLLAAFIKYNGEDPNEKFDLVKLKSPYSDDTTGFGLVHPLHQNEVIAFSNPEIDRGFIIFDCCGDVHPFPLSPPKKAFDEFLSEEGHAMWEDAMNHNQGREDYYFMDKVPSVK
ncbi:hypothetical protein KR49_13475 [Synechococcus sp. KORDI-49]|uniref:hypothetical protein n=1 Tax=Synechococcus sp. KORDI-49 TaxID=585423 RepID=UPI0004E09B23|nr:hypothetical protein [Synechococcus sp. KORDI-49]AII47400.1 hypothetical protein KR49_13475 [Synechococcus sp. KORDI-49]